MDLRDQFAMAALQGLLAGDIVAFDGAAAVYRKEGHPLANRLAEDAYRVADAMLRLKAAQKKPIPVPKPPATSMPSAGRVG